MATDSEDIAFMHRALAMTLAALDVPDGERDIWIAAQCANDPLLRDEVAALLRHDRSMDDSLERLCEAEAQETAESDPVPGSRIGRFRVGLRLGTGGMGTVYRAEPVAGVARLPVALKLIKRGMDSEEILARFMRERDILARLDHPNIARLLDGGMTDDGRPWFALELVDGERLPAYCDSRNLDIATRVDLFLSICDAVAYAHRNLVVHRDIKPGNVLVSGEGVVKLLDFGIAKLLDADAGSTRSAAPMMTPDYAAPEQFAGRPVTTQTDVFQLGMLLRELLCGRPPAAMSRAAGGAESRRMDTLLRELRNSDADAAAAIAQARAVTVPALLRSLRGDLDRIVRRATHPEAERRYTGVVAFADDLRRYRSGRPVSAMGDRLGYRIGKFVQRHRVAVGAVAAALLAMVVGLGLVLRESAALRRAEQQTESALVMLEDVFLGADPYAAKGGDTRATDLLERARDRVMADVEEQPAIAARLLSEIGAAYVSLDDRVAAEAVLREAVRAGDLAGAAARVPASLAAARLAHYKLVVDGDKSFLPQLDRAIDALRAAGPPGWLALAQALQFKADHFFNDGDYAPISALSAEVVDLNRQADGPQSTGLAMALGNHASLLRAAGREADALAPAREAHDIVAAIGDAAPIGVRLYVEQQYAGALSAGNRAAEAEPVLREALASADRLGGASSNLTIGLAWELASTQSAIGRFDEAAAGFQRLLGYMGESKNANVAAVHNALGVAQLARCRPADASAEFAAAIELICAGNPASAPCLAVRLNRVEAQIAQAPSAGTRQDLDALDAIVGTGQERGRQRWRLLDSRWRLGTDDVAGGLAALAPVLAAARAESGPATLDGAYVLAQSAALRESNGDHAGALADYQEAERRMRANWSVETAPLRELRRHICRLSAGDLRTANACGAITSTPGCTVSLAARQTTSFGAASIGH